MWQCPNMCLSRLCYSQIRVNANRTFINQPDRQVGVIIVFDRVQCLSNVSNSDESKDETLLNDLDESNSVNSEFFRSKTTANHPNYHPNNPTIFDGWVAQASSKRGARGRQRKRGRRKRKKEQREKDEWRRGLVETMIWEKEKNKNAEKEKERERDEVASHSLSRFFQNPPYASTFAFLLSEGTEVRFHSCK